MWNFRFQWLCAAPLYKTSDLLPSYSRSLNYLKQIYHFSVSLCPNYSSFVSCHWLSWKSFMQPLYLIFNVLYKFLYSPCHDTFSVCQEHLLKQMCGLHIHWVYICLIFSLYCSSTGFKMLSKSAYSTNRTLTWYHNGEISTIYQNTSRPWHDHCCFSTHTGWNWLSVHLRFLTKLLLLIAI